MGGGGGGGGERPPFIFIIIFEVVRSNSEYTFLLKEAKLSTNMTLKS